MLWAAVKATQDRWPKAICVIYTGDTANKTEMILNAHSWFNIKLYPPTIEFIRLGTRDLLSPSRYPYFTLLGQSLGSLIVGFNAFFCVIPDVFVDTMGYAFAVSLAGFLFPQIATGAYVHYPTISSDMIDSLTDTTGTKGLSAGKAKGLKRVLKRKYWLYFSRLYGFVGSTIDVVMCNSSWTSAHLRRIFVPWRLTYRRYPLVTVLFPPMAVRELVNSIKITPETERHVRQPIILYLAQFRPEKNHGLVLRAFHRLLKELEHNAPNSLGKTKPQLVFIGSVRHNSPDETFIYHLRLQAHDLGIRDNTEFICNAPWASVLDYLRRASIGVNAMWNEHFGMSVVEYQAAGLLSVVHNSGGPKHDIVIDWHCDSADDADEPNETSGPTGYHAANEEEFAVGFETALAMPEVEKVAMRRRTRRSALRFTEEKFGEGWVKEMDKMIRLRNEKQNTKSFGFLRWFTPRTRDICDESTPLAKPIPDQ